MNFAGSVSPRTAYSAELMLPAVYGWESLFDDSPDVLWFEVAVL